MGKTTAKINSTTASALLEKVPSGISGFDEITLGGLPKGRPTLVCGGAGCGKTLFAMEFIARGAQLYNKPGVFVSFEEKADELSTNVKSLGFDLQKMQKEKKIKVEYIHIDKSEIEETGEYDLEGLFIRLGFAIDGIGAKRVVLDTIENLFGNLTNQGILRSELRRLFRWLKDKGVTAIITGEKGEKMLTRHGLEEYVSDCVILLDHRVINQISTRRLRVVKYRGSIHGTNEYPFLIDEEGISVLPVTSLALDKPVSSARVSSGIPTLDNMLGKGFYRGSSILVSGAAGTGKSSIAATFADEACKRNERCLFFVFEESPQQIIRNMKSIGINLQTHIDNGVLQFFASRPTAYGLEMHLVAIHKAIRKFKPKVVVLDPITNLITVASFSDVKSMLVRLIDFLQMEQITVMFTALSFSNTVNDLTDDGVSSLVDSWIQIRDIEENGERNRALYVIKARGIKHSNQVREFIISDNGIYLVDVYLGPEGVLTGSAREAQMLQEQTGELLYNHARNVKDRELMRKRRLLESKIESLRTEFESTEEELNKIYDEEIIKRGAANENRSKMITKRIGPVNNNSKPNSKSGKPK